MGFDTSSLAIQYFYAQSEVPMDRIDSSPNIKILIDPQMMSQFLLFSTFHSSYGRLWSLRRLLWQTVHKFPINCHNWLQRRRIKRLFINTILSMHCWLSMISNHWDIMPFTSLYFSGCKCNMLLHITSLCNTTNFVEVSWFK